MGQPPKVSRRGRRIGVSEHAERHTGVQEEWEEVSVNRETYEVYRRGEKRCH